MILNGCCNNQDLLRHVEVVEEGAVSSNLVGDRRCIAEGDDHPEEEEDPEIQHLKEEFGIMIIWVD